MEPTLPVPIKQRHAAAPVPADCCCSACEHRERRWLEECAHCVHSPCQESLVLPEPLGHPCVTPALPQRVVRPEELGVRGSGHGGDTQSSGYPPSVHGLVTGIPVLSPRSVLLSLFGRPNTQQELEAWTCEPLFLRRCGERPRQGWGSAQGAQCYLLIAAGAWLVSSWFQCAKAAGSQAATCSGAVWLHCGVAWEDAAGWWGMVAAAGRCAEGLPGG